jgi:hypothetical protein
MEGVRQTVCPHCRRLYPSEPRCPHCGEPADSQTRLGVAAILRRPGNPTPLAEVIVLELVAKKCRCVTGRDHGRAPGPNHDFRCPAYEAPGDKRR